jgi:hypothetical protein
MGPVLFAERVTDIPVVRESERWQSRKKIDPNLVGELNRKHGDGRHAADEIQQALARFADHALRASRRRFLLDEMGDLDRHGPAP